MKVILLEDIRGVGKKFEVKDMRDGYARNFLFPKKLAEPATPSALQKLAAMKEAHEKDEAALTARLHEIAEKISGITLQLALEADKSGAIFGSVNKEAVIKALREHDIVRSERVEVFLEHPLKKLGDYKISIDLKKGIKAELKISIVKKSS